MKGPKNKIVWTLDGGDYLSDAERVNKNEGERRTREYEWEGMKWDTRRNMAVGFMLG